MNFDHPFDEILQAGGHADRGFFRRRAEHQQEGQAKDDGETHAVEVDGPEAHFLGFCRAMGYAPSPVRVLAKRQILQVVLDVFARGMCFGHDILV